VRIDYADISQRYDSFRSFPDALRRRVVELGGIGRGTRVLDLGCGTGNAAAALRADPGAEAVGMDRSQAMLEKALSKGVPVIRADADTQPLPFRSGAFETVIGIYVLHHIRDLSGLMRECRRVIGRGHLVLLTAGHAQIEDQHPAIKRSFPSFVRVDKARFPDIPEILRLIHEAGFDHVDCQEFGADRVPLDRAFLEKVKNKYISTYELIPQDEFEEGVRKLEEYIDGLEAPEYRRWRATLVRASAGA